MSRSSARLLDVLVHVQSSLDDDLSLDALARRAGLSPGHFHRIFTARIGETPRAYVQRLRLERVALSLWLRNTTVGAVAEEVGFRRHETLTRAFRRRFGVTPSSMKRGGISKLPSLDPGRGGRGALESTSSYVLSPTRVVSLGALHLVFVRHTGPYEDVPGTLFDGLMRWARDRGIEGHRPLLGIGHDAPGITPPERLRFDAALAVDGPMQGDGRVGYQLFEGRRYAFTTHVGHYRTLPAAYAEIVGRLVGMPGVEFAGVPVVEMYHETRIDTELEFNHTDLYLPIRSEVPSA
ncbi:MAG: helix-turn-helix domain-containing protein [Gemmatimonadota bacterium]|nr:helix-turn-helix domain-containing protein [Gemmatimonadota bacterium]